MFKFMFLKLSFRTKNPLNYICSPKHIVKRHDIHIKPKSYKLELLGELVV